jgi:Xaa-Pro aminopeptidase
MDAQGVDALLVIGEGGQGQSAPIVAPDTYLSNDRPDGVVILPRNGDPVLIAWAAQVVGGHAQGERRGEGSWIKAENIFVGRNPQRLTEVFHAMGLEKSAVGVVGLEAVGPMGEGIISHFAWQGIVAALPNVAFKPVWHDFAMMMSTLGDEEIAVLKQACDAGERMCEALLDITRPGVSEAELYAAALSTSVLNGAYSSWIILQTGPDNTSWGTPNWTFRPVRPRTVEDGDLVLMELFPAYGMLEAQLQLTIAVGDVPDVVQKCADVTRDAYERGLEKCRPGITFGEMADAMIQPILDVGGWFMTPQVHSLNPITLMVSAAGHGLDAMADSHLYPKVTTKPDKGRDIVLQPGMSFAFETNCHLDHRRVNIGGTVVVTENDPLEFNELPNRLHCV